jgi:hypothetical protein
MVGIKKFLKDNRIYIIIAILAVLVLVLTLKPTKPKKTTGFRANFTKVAGAGIQAIQFSLTTPDSFGTGGTKFLPPVIYMIDCGTTDCPTTKPENPTLNDLNTQTVFNNQLNAENPALNWVTLAGSFTSGWDQNLSAPVSGLLSPLTAHGGVTVLNLIPGHSYWFGIGFRNDVKSIFGKDPFNTLIGDFDYVELKYTDVAGPSKPTIGSASFTV